MQNLPLLNYQLSRLKNAEPSQYRFIGSIESVSDDGLLWVRSDNLTVAVSMTRASIFLAPPEGSEDGSLQRLSWKHFPLVLEGTKVFIGGSYCNKEGRNVFCSTKEQPLVVILFEGDERHLVYRVIAASRQPNEYWNGLTPYSLVLGVVSELLIAAFYSGRPALRMTVLAALTGVFIPLMPLLPPGVLLTSFYRRWWRRGRLYRVYRDLLEYILSGEPSVRAGHEDLPLFVWEIKKAGLDENHIKIYKRRSRMLEIYAISAAGFGILCNIFVVLFILQWLFL